MTCFFEKMGCSKKKTARFLKHTGYYLQKTACLFEKMPGLEKKPRRALAGI
jgi:hypothetical protein